MLWMELSVNDIATMFTAVVFTGATTMVTCVIKDPMEPSFSQSTTEML